MEDSFLPYNLFRSGEQGIWLDPSDFSTLFQDAAGTTPVTALGQPVGLIRDKSGRGNHATQTTSASRPTVEARVNLFTKSEQFDDVVWSKAAGTISANATTAPDGTVTADKLTESTNTVTHYVAQAPSVSASTTYTFSGYFKPAGRNNVRITLNYGTTGFNAYFDLVNGIVISNTSGTSASVKKAANGFFRCSFTITTGASATGLGVYIYPADSTPAGTYTGDGTSGIYVWGAQLGAGSYATSYIQTTSAQVTRIADSSSSAQTTRAADSAVISGTNFSQWYKQYEGTVTAESINSTTYNIDSSGYSRGIACFDDDSDSNRIRVGINAGVTSSIRKAGVDQATQTVGSISVGTKKTSISYKKDLVISSVDSVLSSSDTLAEIPYLTQLEIGKGAYFGGKISGHIHTLKYYPKALSSTELQAMTA